MSTPRMKTSRPHSTLLRLATTVLVAALASGCATRQPPAELNLREAFVALGPEHEMVVVNGSSVVKHSVGTGATVGASLGVMGLPAAFPLCAAAFGPAMVFCVVAFVPAAGGIGAGAGALAGRAKSESRETMLTRRDAVKAELVATNYEGLLAEQLRHSLQERHGIEAPATDASSTAAAATWKLEPVVTRVAMYGTLEDAGFKLRVEARLRVRRTSDSAIVYRTGGLVFSEELVGPVDPHGDPVALIRGRLESCLPSLSDQLLAQLVRHPQRQHDSDPEDGNGEATQPPAANDVALAEPER